MMCLLGSVLFSIQFWLLFKNATTNLFIAGYRLCLKFCRICLYICSTPLTPCCHIIINCRLFLVTVFLFPTSSLVPGWVMGVCAIGEVPCQSTFSVSLHHTLSIYLSSAAMQWARRFEGREKKEFLWFFHKSQGRQIGWDSGGDSWKIARKVVSSNFQDRWSLVRLGVSF